MEKLKLNFSLMIKMKRGQDEVTDDVFMEKEEKVEEPILENDALDENMEGNEDEPQENIIQEQENIINQEELNQQQEELESYELLKMIILDRRNQAKNQIIIKFILFTITLLNKLKKKSNYL